MRIRIVIGGLVLGLLAAPVLAHHPLPDTWREAPGLVLVSIGDFDLDETQLGDALTAEMTRQQTLCEDEATSLLRGTGTPDPSIEPTTYWQFEPFSRCGGVERHYEAATTLARTVCEQISAAQRIWPPAVPVVALPHTYLDAREHHSGAYHIDDGHLIGTCVIRAMP